MRSYRLKLLLTVSLMTGLPAGNAQKTVPPGLQGVGIDQRLNEQVPPDLSFHDETGAPVTLQDYFGRKPVILTLVYYQCPMLCSEILSGLARALKPLRLRVAEDFDVVAVSINPEERSDQGLAKKADIVSRYGRKQSAPGWHFLTGDQESIARLAEAVGFRYTYNPATKLFAHASAILILTPQGKIARYLFGVEYPPKDVRLALIEAGEGKIGSLADEILLYCYQYDAAAGRYTPMTLRILKLASGIMLVSLAAFLYLMWRRDLKQYRLKEKISDRARAF